MDLNPWGMYLRMIGSVILAIAALVSVIHVRHHALGAAIPFVLLWIAAPAVARWISVPPPIEDVKPLSPAETRTMRLIALRTWRFLRSLRHRRKITICRRTIFRWIQNHASPIAPPRRIWASTFSPFSPRVISAGSARKRRQTASKRRCTPSVNSSYIAATFSTGTTRRP